MCVDACRLTSCSCIFSFYARELAVWENCFDDLKVESDPSLISTDIVRFTKSRQFVMHICVIFSIDLLTIMIHILNGGLMPVCYGNYVWYLYCHKKTCCSSVVSRLLRQKGRCIGSGPKLKIIIFDCKDLKHKIQVVNSVFI